MKPLLIATLTLAVAVVLAAQAQTFEKPVPPPAVAPDPSATFEVASVKVNKSGDGRIMIGIQPGGRFTATNFTLRGLMRMAYGIQEFQIVGGPDWLDSDRFDIVAKAETELAPTPLGRGNPMLANLLEDRFKLATHRDTREMPTYALMLSRGDGKLGPGMKPSAVDCSAIGRGRGAAAGPQPFPPPGERPQCGMRMFPGNLSGGGVLMPQLVQFLSTSLRRVVVDRTGLTDGYDIDLTYTPDQIPQGPPPPGAPPLPAIDPNGPSLFTALQEQLGLKLDSTRGPVDVVVVDRAEHPTPD